MPHTHIFKSTWESIALKKNFVEWLCRQKFLTPEKSYPTYSALGEGFLKKNPNFDSYFLKFLFLENVFLKKMKILMITLIMFT